MMVAVIEIGLMMHLWGAALPFVWEENPNGSHRLWALKWARLGYRKRLEGGIRVSSVARDPTLGTSLDQQAGKCPGCFSPSKGQAAPVCGLVLPGSNSSAGGTLATGPGCQVGEIRRLYGSQLREWMHQTLAQSNAREAK